MASTLPAFRTALKAALDAHATITTNQVLVYKYLIPNIPAQDYIEFTTALLVNEWQAQATKKEEYELRINLWSLVAGSEEADTTVDNAATQAETKCLTYADAVAALLLADKTVGGTVNHSEWQGGEITNQTNDEGRWCLYVGRIMVKAFNV